MRKLIKKVRSNFLINRFVRNVIHSVNKKSEKAMTFWPLFGQVNLDFNGIDFKAYSNGDDHIMRALYYQRAYNESVDLSCFINLARRSKVILDIGANTGIYSILSGKANAQTSIYAFEPFASNAERFRKNMELNALPHVRLINKAVGEKDDVIKFTVPADNSISDTSSALEDFSKGTYSGGLQWKTIEVPQVSIDSFASLEKLERIDLVKIDVEGYEIMVFKGAQSSIKKYAPVIQCEIFVNEEKRTFFNSFLQDFGYTAYMIMSKGLLRLDEGLIPNPDGLNFLFAKKKLPNVLTPFENALELIEK